jgi:hypothetical protein
LVNKKNRVQLANYTQFPFSQENPESLLAFCSGKDFEKTDEVDKLIVGTPR